MWGGTAWPPAQGHPRQAVPPTSALAARVPCRDREARGVRENRGGIGLSPAVTLGHITPHAADSQEVWKMNDGGRRRRREQGESRQGFFVVVLGKERVWLGRDAQRRNLFQSRAAAWQRWTRRCRQPALSPGPALSRPGPPARAQRPGSRRPGPTHSPSSSASSRSGTQTASSRARRCGPEVPAGSPRPPGTMAPPGASLAGSATPRRAVRRRCPARTASSAVERGAESHWGGRAGRGRGPASPGHAPPLPRLPREEGVALLRVDPLLSPQYAEHRPQGRPVSLFSFPNSTCLNSGEPGSQTTPGGKTCPEPHGPPRCLSALLQGPSTRQAPQLGHPKYFSDGMATDTSKNSSPPND
jgi:hypothetical protein